GSKIALGDPGPLTPTLTLALPAASPSGSYTAVIEVTDASGNVGQASAVIAYVIPDDVTARLKPSYQLAAVLDYNHASIAVTETMTVTNGSDQPVDRLNLSVLPHAYGELSLSGPVTVDDQAVTPTWPNSAELRIPLGTPLAPGAQTTVVIPFAAAAKTDTSDSLRARFSKLVDTNGVVLLQASSWYPVLSTDHGLRNPGDSQFTVAAPVTMTLDYPATVPVAGVAKSLRVALPGVVTTVTSQTPGRKIATVKLAAARELAFAASPRFVQASSTTTRHSTLGHPITVTAYYFPGEPGAAAAATARATLDTLTASYGAYSYDRLVVALSTRTVSGNEYSGVVFLGSSKIGSAYAVSHEVAHQWFYHLVGSDQLVAPWLDEGFAEYTGRLAAGISMPTSCSTLPVDLTVYAFPNKPADGACNGYVQTVYYRTCVLLAGVRSRIGASAFTAALREIVATFRGTVVTEANVVAIFEKHATNPSSLDRYLRGFLAGPPVT
ncbi:MAG TPA: M1 family aminopeptidase, partial [Candidatus Limnocylindrales bacterium]